ncbi:MAG: 4Fe-4S binding protein [bacterium]|nr:4Fe-4S binding protein [bacterium]
MDMDMTSCCHMAGIPNWLYYSSIVVVMLVSFIILEIFRKKSSSTGEYKKFELTRFRAVRFFFKSRFVQFVVRLVVLGLFGLVIYAGFYGNQHPGENIAPSLTWNIWWIGLIFLILFFGKMWCYACPWDAFTNGMTRLSIFKVKKSTINLGWKWPKFLKNIYLATFFFILLTWLELGYHVTLSPEATAILALVMLSLVFLPGLLFEKKSFCQYGCLIGRISGLYAMFSPVEIRRRSADVCNSCKTIDCFKGNDRGYPCPTNRNLRTMEVNTYCTMCAECFRSCPHDNVAFNVRSFGKDLLATATFRKDESYLCITLFALTAFHGLTMTPVWKTLVRDIQASLGIGEIPAFSIGMAGCLLLPFVLYSIFVWLSRFIAGERGQSFPGLFIKFAYGLLPIALFYHIAHNVEHFFMEGQKMVVLVSDPFGYGWDLFGTANMQVTSILSLQTIWYIQVVMIIIGHVFGIIITHKHSYQIFDSRGAAVKSQIPMIALMIMFSVLSLWLVAQPMQMRTAM